ncbi:hypothetical protein [Legionella sp. PC997]|uniref:hypothetical protein n=1 Tax=Legionella sp. PC997 TaxID=2755562 RepID=UPI0015F8E42D|nr:hypothetical protein [Legionella sp. PC997]QMT61861.1 hypothetical protein HBNCFIEN_03268 [Legionella sp. PC997]
MKRKYEPTFIKRGEEQDRTAQPFNSIPATPTNLASRSLQTPAPYLPIIEPYVPPLEKGKEKVATSIPSESQTFTRISQEVYPLLTRKRKRQESITQINSKQQRNSPIDSTSLLPAKKRQKQDGRPGLALSSFLNENILNLLDGIPALGGYNSKIKALQNTWKLLADPETNRTKLKDIISKYAQFYIFAADREQFVVHEMLNINYDFFLVGLHNISEELIPLFIMQEGKSLDGEKADDVEINKNVTEIIHNLYSQIMALRCIKEIYANPLNPMPFPRRPISEEEAIRDFKELVKQSEDLLSNGYTQNGSYPLYHTVVSQKGDKTGKTAVEFFTQIERFKATAGARKVSVYDMWQENNSAITYKLRELFRLHAQGVSSIGNLPKSIGIKEINQVLTRQLAVSQYSPIILLKVIEVLKKHYQFKAERIHFLDLCGGWGARRIAALAHPSIDSYLSIDPNPALIEPYEQMTHLFKPFSGKDRFISQHIPKKIEEVTIDTDNIGKFNLAITSPPYRNLEQYNKKSNGGYEEQEYIDDAKWQNFMAHCMWVLSLYVVDGGLIALNLANMIHLRKCYFLTGDVVNEALSKLEDRLPLELVAREEKIRLYNMINIFPDGSDAKDTLAYPLEFQGSIIQQNPDSSLLNRKIKKDSRFQELEAEQIPSDRESYVVFRKIAVLPKLGNCLRLNGLFKTVFTSPGKICLTEYEAVRERHRLQVLTKENKIYDKSTEQEAHRP